MAKEKEKDKATRDKKKVKPKAEQRHRVLKNVGKRRKPSNPDALVASAEPASKAAVEKVSKVLADKSGFAALKRRPKTAP